MTTAAADRRPTRHLTATARPFPLPAHALPHVREAAAILATERAPGADYRPADLPVLAAWDETRELCRTDHAGALRHLEAYFAMYLDALRDLALRARDGAGPTTFLDEVERVLIAHA